MQAQHDTTTPSSAAAGWHWGDPSRPGMQRMIPQWEFRHLRTWGRVRIAAGIALAVLGVATLFGDSTTAFVWAAVLLVLAAASFSYAAWELGIARRASSS